ncbi:uncharacterized protein A4U43_C09F4460 [Asparagus officinalis]|uniref:Ubiquitin-like protease family profile domain-containing protein n=1 Tax=Asparagus officinalis TaxID=4686 RepID=A0A5P1E5J0_ASPOF|nr:uncharacterized protein A4U43_C09F4460 [Asparagus officinalis]
MPLDQPKEGTKKRRVIQILDSPEGKKSAKIKKASYLHLETIQVIDAFVIRLCNKIETTNSYDRKIHVTRPWLAQAFLEGNLKMVAKRMNENVSQQKFLEGERILIPIVSSGHWHLVELVREETKFYHYSSINSPIYTADAVKFINKFMSFIESNWGLGKLEHHGLVSVAVPQQGPTLD